MPFLSIVTRRHGDRPTLWERHSASLAAQSCRDFEHVVFPGGDTLTQANRSLYQNREKVRGDYVLVLDDDDRLTEGAVEAIRDAVSDRPGVLLVRMDIGGRVLPEAAHWENPRRGQIGSSCFVVRRDLWQRHIRHWAQPRAGDFFFIRAVLRSGASTAWLDRVCSETMRVSEGRGEGEEAEGPVLVTMIPYDAGGDLGAAYNDGMERLRDGEWAVFLDHDAAFLTGDWHRLVRRAIAANPRAGLMTATTNRIGNPGQLDRSVDGHDVKAHRRHARLLSERHGAATVDVTRGAQKISGVVLATSRSAWEKVRASNGYGFESGLLGVDNAYHKGVAACGFSVHIIRGLYVYHWYRGDGDRSHLSNGRRVVSA